MSLPIAWIDRIFDRLIVRYGNRFLDRWKGVNMDAVRFDWATVLDGFDKWPDAISFAIDNLDDEKPPSATMFRTLALKAPKPALLALPEPKADPDRIKAELAKLAPLKAARSSTVDHKAWAHAMQRRDAAGEPINLNQRRCYKAALGLEAA